MFDATWVMAIISGITMLGFGAWVLNSEKNAGLANMGVGVLFLGYGIYLGFFFTGGYYFTSLWLFAAPLRGNRLRDQVAQGSQDGEAPRSSDSPRAEGYWQVPPAPGQWPAHRAHPVSGPRRVRPVSIRLRSRRRGPSSTPQAQPTPWTGQYPQAGTGRGAGTAADMAAECQRRTVHAARAGHPAHAADAEQRRHPRSIVRPLLSTAVTVTVAAVCAFSECRSSRRRPPSPGPPRSSPPRRSA